MWLLCSPLSEDYKLESLYKHNIIHNMNTLEYSSLFGDYIHCEQSPLPENTQEYITFSEEVDPGTITSDIKVLRQTLTYIEK